MQGARRWRESRRADEHCRSVLPYGCSWPFRNQQTFPAFRLSDFRLQEQRAFNRADDYPLHYVVLAIVFVDTTDTGDMKNPAAGGQLFMPLR